MTAPPDKNSREAAALRIAYENLIRLGWPFSSADIGRDAAKILKAMTEEPQK